MNEYCRAVGAECLKLKRTSALMVAIVTPYIAILLQFIIALSIGKRIAGTPGWPWLGSNTLVLWAGLLLPLLVSLMAAYLADLESRNHQWKHLFALPVSRGTLYAAKQTAGVLLLLLSMVLLSVGLWMAGLLLRVLRPGMGLEEPFPLGLWLSFAGAVFGASGLILAIHTWLSLRWPSFVVAVAVGVLATVFAMSLGMMDDGTIWHYFPWRWPANVVQGLSTQTVEPTWWVLGIGGGLVFAVIGGWDVTRRDVL